MLSEWCCFFLLAAYVFIDSIMHPSSTIPYSVRKKYQVSLRLGVGAFGEVSLVFDKVVHSELVQVTLNLMDYEVHLCFNYR